MNESIESVVARIEADERGNAFIHPDVMGDKTPFMVASDIVEQFKGSDRMITSTASREGVMLMWAPRIDPEDGAA